MKKLILILILGLAGCNNNGKLIMDNGELTGNSTSQVNTGGQDNKIVGSGEQEVKNKNIIGKSSEISKELNKEFSNIYSPEDSNHYENKCYLLLDVDYKNKQFVLYRNKGVGVGTGGCKLDGVKKIGVMWYHDGKPDPDGEYILRSYNPETGLFKYVMSEKYGNLGNVYNGYEFRFYLKNGKVLIKRIISEATLSLNKNKFLSHMKFYSEYFDKYGVYKILKEKCGVKSYAEGGDFDINLIPTKKGETINLSCEYGDGVLTYNGNNEYTLGIEGLREPTYYFYMKNGKIIKEGYPICNKLFKDYRYVDGLAIGDLEENKCKIIDISSGFKYSGYYARGKLLSSLNDYVKNGQSFYTSGYDNLFCNYISGDNKSAICTNFFNSKMKIKVNVKYYNNGSSGFLLYTSNGSLLFIKKPSESDSDMYDFYKTFLNGKEVK